MPFKGYKQTKKHIEAQVLGRKSEKSSLWKGDDAKYSAIHRWVRKWTKEPKECQICGKKNIRLELANIDHKYKRILDNYVRMCCFCHSKYDKENKLGKWKNK